MSELVRRFANSLALVLWLLFLPVWLGAVATATLLMTLVVVGNLLTGRDVAAGQSALDDIAQLWPRGTRAILANVAGRAGIGSPSAERPPNLMSLSRLMTILVYSAVFWGVAYVCYRWLFQR